MRALLMGVSGTVKGSMALQIIKEEEPKYT